MGIILTWVNKPNPGSYSPIFNQDWYKATLIVLNLIRYGDINPLTFERLRPELFDGDRNTVLYQPHHIDSSLNYLPQCNTILIFDPMWHGRCKISSITDLGISLQKELRDGVLELMSINRDIDERDIRRVFGDLTIFNRKVADWWIGNPNFNSLVSSWNLDRESIRTKKIDHLESFLEGFRLSNGDSPIIDRYWDYAKKTISAFLMLHNEYDLSYLFTDADKDFLIKHFKIEDLL